MERRLFLKIGAGAGVSTVLSGCSRLGLEGPLVRGDLDQGPTARNTLPGLSKNETAILYYASLAPSGHNAQPWYVRIEAPGKWLVGLDKKRCLPAVDPENREALLSLGAFVENLVLAAGALGRPARVEVLADRPVEAGVARLTLGQGPASGYPLKRLLLRRTVKHGFKPDPLKPADLKALTAVLKGRLHYFPKDSDHAQCISQGAVEAFRAQIKRDAVMEEMARWTRFGNKEARKYRDGLTPAGMEISGLTGFYVRNFFKPKDVESPKFRQAGLELTAKLAREGCGWLIVTGSSGSVPDLIETGRRFERLALLLRERSLAVHPMTQMLEERAGQEVIKANHPDGILPQMILRVGYLGKYPDPVSLRRPPGWFVGT